VGRAGSATIGSAGVGTETAPQPGAVIQ
jgi:hypothetical protein